MRTPVTVVFCAAALAAAACAGKTHEEPARPAALHDSGIDAAVGATGGLAPCDTEQGSGTAVLMADHQRSPGEVIASAAGLVWLNGSETFGPCSIRGCAGLSDGQVMSWPAGETAPRVVATGLRPMSVAASADLLVFDLWGTPAGLATQAPDVGMVPRDGSAAPVIGNVGPTWMVPVRIESDDDDVFVLFSSAGTGYYSAARAKPASFADPDTWTRVTLDGAGRGFDTALDRDSFYVAADTGLLALDRVELAPRWFFGPDIVTPLPAGSVTVDDTHVYYVLGQPPELGEDPIFGPIARMTKDGTAPKTLVPTETNPRDLEVDATHLYWLTSDTTCSRLRRAPKTGGGAETVLATSDRLTSIALDDSWIYVTVTTPIPQIPEELPPASGRVLRVAKR